VIPRKLLEEKFRRFVEEDVGQGDITTMLTIPAKTTVKAKIVAKEAGVIAGIEEALIFLECYGFQAEPLVSDGAKVKPKTTILEIVGDARTLLTIERTLLNLLSRMSGIATTTNKLVEKVREAGHKTRIACTRKVAPGLSYFDKKAVMIGGGDTHRLHLDDMILIKDNHLAIVNDIAEAIRKVREAVSFSKKVEVEASTTEQAMKAAEAGADIVMLDNFAPEQARKTVELMRKKGFQGKVLIEASGGITEENLLEFAAAGVDIISLGEITHSPKALDLSLEIMKTMKQPIRGL
jgi:nicotinate-nucleotide pyrophosphorylase (carboxylating)